MHPKFDVESLTLFPIHLCRCILIHGYYHFCNVNWYFPMQPSRKNLSIESCLFLLGNCRMTFVTDTIHSFTPIYLPRHLSKSKAIHWSFFFARYFSCSCRNMKILVSVIFLSAINPNCVLSIFTIFLTPLSITLHAPARATCQCIILSFVNIHHPTRGKFQELSFHLPTNWNWKSIFRNRFSV